MRTRRVRGPSARGDPWRGRNGTSASQSDLSLAEGSPDNYGQRRPGIVTGKRFDVGVGYLLRENLGLPLESVHEPDNRDIQQGRVVAGFEGAVAQVGHPVREATAKPAVRVELSTSTVSWAGSHTGGKVVVVDVAVEVVVGTVEVVDGTVVEGRAVVVVAGSLGDGSAEVDMGAVVPPEPGPSDRPNRKRIPRATTTTITRDTRTSVIIRLRSRRKRL